MLRLFKGMILGACAMLAVLPASALAQGKVSCELRFQMSGWSIFYKESNGSGTIKCSNGESMAVKLQARGGGLTVGKSTIEDGHGEFSGVQSINDLIGTYVSAEAHAGAVKSAKAQVVTKGEVSLALSGTGSGWDLGVAVGNFIISRR